MDRVLCDAILAKIEEQVERTDHLVGLLAEDHLDWKPAIPGAFSAGVVLGHLLECMAGFCAVLFAFDKKRLSHFEELRSIPLNQRCNPREARERISIFGARIREGFALLHDSALAEKIPTVFVSGGESLLTLLLGNLEHLVNHKHQLFMYLRLMGVDAGSRDLYHFRGE